MLCPGAEVCSLEQIELRLESAFVMQEETFALHSDAAGKAAETLRRDDPVTGDDDSNRISAAGTADRLGRAAQLPGEVAVGGGLTERDLAHQPPDGSMKGAASGRQGQVEILPAVSEVRLELADGLDQKR